MLIFGLKRVYFRNRLIFLPIYVKTILTKTFSGYLDCFFFIETLYITALKGTVTHLLMAFLPNTLPGLALLDGWHRMGLRPSNNSLPLLLTSTV